MYTIVITLLKLYRKRVEWDSDNDDIVSVTAGGEENYYRIDFNEILGFHPYKKVVTIAIIQMVYTSHLYILHA